MMRNQTLMALFKASSSTMCKACLLYTSSRIPAAIVEHQSVNVPNLRGSSITSMAVKAAVKELSLIHI